MRMSYRLSLDHLVVVAATLEEGVAHVRKALGVEMDPGGSHPAMGTHNRLLSLGPEIYLEVISIDPSAKPPSTPRWFDMDSFYGPPKLTHWVCKTDNMDAALANGPPDWGMAQQLERGEFRWQFAVPETGRLPFADAAPALIQWAGTAHPAQRLPDKGLILETLTVATPDIAGMSEDIPSVPKVSTLGGSQKALTATINGPEGLKVLR